MTLTEETLHEETLTKETLTKETLRTITEESLTKRPFPERSFMSLTEEKRQCPYPERWDLIERDEAFTDLHHKLEASR